MKVLNHFFQSIKEKRIPDFSVERLAQLKNESEHLQNIAMNPSVVIYGSNTLTGHRDNELFIKERNDFIENEILDSHAIGSSPWYSTFTVYCISYAKLYSWAAGNSGVSKELFNNVSDIVCSNEFAAKIPKHCSYSCGDVIPGSHWAKEVLKAIRQTKKYTVKSGEVMALINGNFVSLGYAASLIPKIRKSWIYFIELTSIVNSVSKSNTSNLFGMGFSNCDWVKSTVQYISSNAQVNSYQKNIQDPISIRSIPQQIILICSCIEEYIKEVEVSLMKPSGNPLFDLTEDLPISQSSFLNPKLTIKAEGLVEAVLFLMWAIVGRINYLLSGKVEGIPKDGSNKHSIIGLIQYPKLIMAKLEKARSKYGRRTFSSGSQTSYGLEDLWSNNETVLEELSCLLDEFQDICSIELIVLKSVIQNTKIQSNSELINIIKDGIEQHNIKYIVCDHIDNNGLKLLTDIFPLKV